MGLFNRSSGNGQNDKTYEENGFVIGVDNHIIYHVPKIQIGSIYILPDGTTNLTESAILEMRQSKPSGIIVPGSFKKFNIQLFNFEYLDQIVLQEGIEEVKCTFGSSKNAVDFKLPSTIKKIGKGNYPVVQKLVLPNGVVEIDPLFASHDTYLVSVTIPGTIKDIPQGAFNQCRNLQSVIISEGVETSGKDVFRGTNNLRLLEIPSTYNGTINLSMEARAVSSPRGNSKYDVTRFNDELNEELHIKIKRGEKIYEFKMKRGEQPEIKIWQNNIQIRCINQQQVISINCDVLEQGLYNIENGIIDVKKHESTYSTSTQTMKQPTKQEEEVSEKLDIIFQNAYREYITRREDFRVLSTPVKMKIKVTMRQFFLQNVKRSGKINDDYDTFDNMFGKVLKELDLDNNSQELINLNNSGKRR